MFVCAAGRPATEGQPVHGGGPRYDRHLCVLFPSRGDDLAKIGKLQGSSGQSCALCGVARGWRCRPVSDYAMRAPTRISMMSRVSRRRGTLRHSSCSIVRPPRPDTLLSHCSPIFLLFPPRFSGCLRVDALCFIYSRLLSPFFSRHVLLYHCTAIIHKSSLTIATFSSLTPSFPSLWLCSFHIRRRRSGSHFHFVSF